eukprot:Gregarina_sp_Poly_1__7782@NODE_43_length_18077_cov_117_559078_g37_i0_p6_GENE_NODE_43_length_18077_cov_117_559078_g37_i0NODE_43_length_18077_cov_117_559078_g37_i0_p6_ORF_typecomplete_len407_score63_98Es2/PF09751_9/1_5e33DUF5078/PF16877_5/0_058AMPKBI/PF04739_15/0_38_NODE_43_length_18077_cov_117_559078_g37_i078079027
MNHHRQVLPEEEYEDKLEEIIRRDFYPLNQPKGRIQDINVEEPDRDSDGYPIPSRVILQHLSVDEFIATHTTEEDVQFQNILQDEEKIRQSKLAWVNEQSRAHNQKMLALRDSLDEYEKVDTGNKLVGGKVLKALNENATDGLMLPRHNAEATVHFAPKGPVDNCGVPLIDGIQNCFALGGQESSDKAVVLASHPFLTKPPKPLVLAANTRFDLETERNISSDLVSTPRLEWQQAQSLRERKLDECLDSGKFTPSLDPRILQTPTIIPDNVEEQIMTWGVLGSTPVRLKDDESEPLISTRLPPPEDSVPTTAFLIPDQSDREKAADELHRSTVQRDRKRRRSAMVMKSEIQGLSMSRDNKTKRHAPGTTQTPLTGTSIFGGPNKTPTVLDTPLAQALMRKQNAGGK